MIVVGHMFLTALVIGTAAAVLGTGRVTIPLVLSTTLIWAWVPVVQLLTGLLFVGRGGPGWSTALAHYFATSRYWSLWILVVAGLLLLVPGVWRYMDCLIVTFVLPIGFTSRALAKQRRELFGDSRGAAIRRVALHQLVTHTVLVLYFAWAVALPPRIVAGQLW